ncbi:MAG: prolipoprotein diacylglyceryl transferase [Clostridia bacterium]|nr:prolipoprotein diacylglyceryl transferase [Clostridia bacterium]
MAAFVQSFLAHFSLYNFIDALGLIAALGYALHRLGQSGFDGPATRRILASALAAFICGVCAANVFNWLVFPELLGLPLLPRIRTAGLTFYPGMICAISLCAILWRALGLPVGRIFALTVPAFPLFHAIARLGCAAVGCCYGREISLFGCRTVFPYQLVEAAFLLALFFFLHLRRPRHPALWYFTAYPLFRFFAEFLRGDDRGTLIPGIPLSVSQQISLAVLAGVLVYSIIIRIPALRKDGYKR